jgi:CubicO group peptidase (beta-lactamase class C family)
MKRLFTLAVLLFLLQKTDAQPFNPQLAAMLQDTLNKYTSLITNIKGMSVSVYIPGQGIWRGCAGVSYAGQAITPDMEFGIASNTKLFVSTAMLILQENDLLDLDDSIGDWLPTYPNIDPNITIRQLLNHTSGISDPIFLSPHIDTIMAHPTRVFTPNEVLGWVGAPLFAPGTSWGYSNINYILAGMIAENASGFHISQIIRDSILTPLNLDSTFYDVEEPEIGTIAHRWYNTIDYHDTSRVGLNTAGGCAGAMFSTSGEMAQWYHALMNGQVLSPASFAELTNFVTTPAPYTYGLGLENQAFFGHTLYGHGGATWGYRSKVFYDPCMDIVVFGIANSYPAGSDGVVLLLYKTVVDHLPACAGAISGQISVCQGEDSVTYTVSPIPNATSYTWTLPNGAVGNSITNSITVNYGLSAVSSNISVRGTNTYGSGGVSSLAITVTNKPPTPLITQTGNDLQSNAPSGNQWYDLTGSIIGANAPAYTAIADGEYYCIVTVDGCSSDSSNHIYVILADIEETFADRSFTLYPNPANGELFLDPKGIAMPASYEIIDPLGHVITAGNISGAAHLSIAGLTKGVYFLRLFNSDKTSVKRFMVQP